MIVWFDTEFIEDGKTIELVSIGLVSQDGRELYLENSECDLSRAGEWVQKNVIPNLTGNGKTREQIKQSIVAFSGPNPEFWAYFAAYDWVVLCQLFGTMMELPAHWPMYCKDVQQERAAHGMPKLPEQSSTKHNALNDARWARDAYLSMRAA